ncbi:MAG TPA: hypothetical protein VIN77_03935 [Aurantimonas sp.]
MGAFPYPGTLGASLLLAGSLSACAATDGTASGPASPPATIAAAFPTTANAEPDRMAHRVGPSAAAISDGKLTPAEIAYVNGTAAAIYRRRAVERATSFAPTGDAGGYGICVRSPAAKGGYDVALVVIARRLYGEPISQVDDDTIVLRRAADTGVCRSASVTYVAARVD